MNSLYFRRTATLFAVILASACSTSQNGSGNKASKLHALVEAHFEAYLKLYPLFATSIGDTRFDDQLTIPLTSEHRTKEKALIEDSLSQALSLGCNELGEQDTLTCESFVEDLLTSKRLSETSLDPWLPFDQFDSFFSEFAELASGSSYVTFKTPKDYENFAKRMGVIPDYFDAMISNMREGVKNGVTTPAVLVRKGLKQVQALLVQDYKKSVFFKPAMNFPVGFPESDRVRLRSLYERQVEGKVYPAYRKLEAFVRKEYLPKARATHGISAVRGGPEFYLALIKAHTTTNLKPGEIMETGLAEVKRIRDEFEMAKLSLDYKGSLKSFFKDLRKDPKLYPFKTAEEVMGAYQAIHRRLMEKVPTLFARYPKAPFEIREVEKFRAESASEAYQNPTPDGSRPGIFWVPVPDARKYAAKSMESLFLHEAIPGHHFQIALQQELDLPRFRRFGGNNAYVEGWALYAESLGKKLGLYTDPYQWIGRLEGEMHRAIRLVVDTGIHAFGWTREKAIQFSLDNEPADESGIISEVERYMAIPGQALSYKLGELKIHELREKARRALREKFDIRIFHEQILKDGPLPLSILEQKIDRWIASVR